MREWVACAALSLGLAMTAIAEDAPPGAVDPNQPAPHGPPSGAPEAEAPATPEPAAPATPAARTFMLFFDHGEVGTPQDADPLLPQVAEIYKRTGYTKVAIVCHSDKGKTHEAELKLTQGRADRVKATLVIYGIAAGAITATGVGYADPLPGAPPDMAVSNRRCEITLS